MAYMRSCYLCGKEYRFCPTCREDRHAPAWKNTFCSEDCSSIFKCAVDYNMNMITKEEAQDILLGCDLSNQKSFREGTQSAIAKIMEEPKKEEIKVDELKKEEEPKFANKPAKIQYQSKKAKPAEEPVI